MNIEQQRQVEEVVFPTNKDDVPDDVWDDYDDEDDDNEDNDDNDIDDDDDDDEILHVL